MRRFLTWSFALLTALSVNAQLTLETCFEKGIENYPLLKQYGLLEQTRKVELDEINTGWLPRIGVYSQATAQNVVPSFPSALTGVLDQMGQHMEGLGKLQYKVGADLSQNIWDGGASKARREVAVRNNEVGAVTLDCELYGVRERILNIYFAILLTETQIDQNKETARLIENNVGRLKIMLAHGTAMQSDVDMAEAQLLSMAQAIASAESAAKGYRKVLGLYIGEQVGETMLELPVAEIPDNHAPERPELTLLRRRGGAALAMQKLSDVSLMPKIGLFVQAYYGYPGFNYFKSMMNREMSFNVLAGLRVSWNIDSFYSRKTNHRKTDIELLRIESERETFLFNNNLQVSSQMESLEGLRKVMKEDERITELRANVRKAAESQLNNGVIDTFGLLLKIGDENLARMTAKLHEIQYVQEIYQLKHTLNR